MERIQELLSRDLNHKIEEIIKLDQTDEQAVATELREYILTERIEAQYFDLFKAMAEASADPHEGVGVWVSGFFGSGKSSFAKNLGYILSNRIVMGQKASDLFKKRLTENHVSERAAAMIDSINLRFPSEVIMFDVTVERAVKRATEKMAEIMYTVLLRELDYAQDYDLAELEIELEQEGRLEEITALCVEEYGAEWRKVRKGAQSISRASALLHKLDPNTYQTKDSWAQSLRNKRADITVRTFVERAFELCARRRPGRALAFIIDEVGQYVARSPEKIEDLRGIVEQFGKVSKNYLLAKKIIAPAWIVVTSQEKLDEVVASIDSKRVELAKLQDRFKYRVDLAPADIREVATRRVLAKTEAGEQELRKMYQAAQGQLNAACRLEKTTRRSAISEDDFVQFYPYLPHYIEMSIAIMSGVRLQPGAPRHFGGSNRTIIKQAYEMLVSERTALAAQPIGTLVTLDKVFELVEGNLSTEKQKDISDITDRFGPQHDAVRVAKAVCLLEFVRDVPRTEHNIAACLVERVGAPAPLAAVQAAVKELEQAQFIRNTEEGWKLQTAQEKNWETERRAYEPKPRDRNELVRHALREIFDEPQLKKYRYKNLRTFQLGISVDGVRVGAEGDAHLALWVADDGNAFSRKLTEARTESRDKSHEYDIYWVCAATPEIDDLVARCFASQQMIGKYEQARANNRINAEDASLLETERHEAARCQSRLREKMVEALEKGQGMFRGVVKDGAGLGKTAHEIFKGLFDAVFPDLYPKLEMGTRQQTGREIEEILKAANLNGLSPIFYDGSQGLNLVIKEGARWVVNPNAEIAKEVLDFIRREHSYGNKVMGKNIQEQFGGLGYGWDSDILRLVLATLLRAGVIEVTYQGRRYRNYQDPQGRAPLTAIPAFKAASFVPRESIGLKTLTSAVTNLEDLTGEEVEIEEVTIANAFKKLADEEIKLLLSVMATVRAHGLPLSEFLEEYRQTLNGIQSAASDDCVRILAGEGRSFKEQRDRVQGIRQAISESGLRAIKRARIAADTLWQVLVTRPAAAELAATAEDLQKQLASDTFYEHIDTLAALSGKIVSAYHELYSSLHRERGQVYLKAIAEIKESDVWPLCDQSMHASVLAQLTARACDNLDLPETSVECTNCRANLGTLESDLAAVSFLQQGVMLRLQALAAPPESEGVPIKRVKVKEFFIASMDSAANINAAIERLRAHLLKLVAEGAQVVLE